MKKGFVALLIALALIVLVSPGIVGHFAERSMEENLDWAATENREVVVTSTRGIRGCTTQVAFGSRAINWPAPPA